MSRPEASWLAAAAVGLLCGCAAGPAPLPDAPAFPGTAPAHDLRADYRAAACARLAPGAAACERLLRREAGEPATANLPAAAASDYRIGLVPGLFAQCLAGLVRPFADVEEALRTRGESPVYFDLAGRGTVAANGRALATAIADARDDPRPWILVAYSKGLTDALELAAQYPEAAGRVAAIVSFAGASGGSPLADTLAGAYRAFVATLPLPGCADGTGEEIRDLRRDQRAAWWSRNGARVRVPVFSVVTMPSRERVSFGSWTTYRRLSSIDPRNDGKLLWHDQLVPGGYLLGFVDADHWTIAVPLARTLPALAFLFHDDLPRPALVDAALDVVARALAHGRAPRPARQ